MKSFVKFSFFIFLLSLPFVFAECYLRSKINSLPVNRIGYFQRGNQVLFQDFSLQEAQSKGWYVLAGDSHVAGNSDELYRDIEAGKDHSFPAEKLSQLLGVPVLGIGSSGDGPLRSFYQSPKKILNYLFKSHLNNLPQPSAFIFVFYEGNDLDDALKDFVIPFLKTHPSTDLQDINKIESFSNLLEQVNNPPIIFEDERRFLILDYLLGLVKSFSTLKSLDRYSMLDGKTWFETNVNLLKNGKFLPTNIQGPAPELSSSQLDRSLQVMRFSIKMLRRQYSHTKFILVYLPSTATSYELKRGERFKLRSFQGNKDSFDVQEIESKHQNLKTMVKKLTHEEGGHFFDSTPHLKKVSQDQFIHGPRDWHHLNHLGRNTFLSALSMYVKTIEDLTL